MWRQPHRKYPPPEELAQEGPLLGPPELILLNSHPPQEAEADHYRRASALAHELTGLFLEAGHEAFAQVSSPRRGQFQAAALWAREGAYAYLHLSSTFLQPTVAFPEAPLLAQVGYLQPELRPSRLARQALRLTSQSPPLSAPGFLLVCHESEWHDVVTQMAIATLRVGMTVPSPEVTLEGAQADSGGRWWAPKAHAARSLWSWYVSGLSEGELAQHLQRAVRRGEFLKNQKRHGENPA